MALPGDSPIELPGGRLVCGPHWLAICPICTVDYSFMEEDDEEDEEEEEEEDEDEDHLHSGGFVFRTEPMTELRVGTGLVIPTKFNPPNAGDTPQSLFPFQTALRATPPVNRFIRRSDDNQFLIYTDGACLGNGGTNPRAGCSFIYRSTSQPPQVNSYVRFPLESRGPTGEQHPQTSNRAELRAVIGALRFRNWAGESFSSLVIATDSEYVIEGITKWVRGWLRNGWKTRTRAPVMNQDLWQCLLGEVERLQENGLRIQFWRIPRQWNTEADFHAKEAAVEGAPAEFTDVIGVVV